MNTNEIKETTEKELAKAYKRCFWSAVAFVAGVFISMMLCGCKQTEYVTVPEVHEVHHHHTDSVHEVDSGQIRHPATERPTWLVGRNQRTEARNRATASHSQR